MLEELAIFIGSERDMEAIKASKMQEILQTIMVSYSISICSGHRQEEKLSEILARKIDKGVRVFIGMAGMSAVLPGVIQSKVLYKEISPPPFVIGVALPSSDFPNALDAMLTIVRNPSGVPVAFAGIGKSGLENAALLAVQVIARNNHIVGRHYIEYLIVTRPAAKEDLIAADTYLDK